MRVLVGCEFSGVVRRAFREKGHDAYSCDLLPAEDGSKYHIMCDVLEVIDRNWDLAIFHPPCTYLTTTGNRAFKENPERYKLRDEALEFVLTLYNADIPKIAIENPQGYLNTLWRRPDQCIHPYMFGDNQMKRTCLWLKGLPKLYHTVNDLTHHIEKPPEPYYVQQSGKKKGQRIHWCEMGGPTGIGNHRSKRRSTTFPGIARAMADQWG